MNGASASPVWMRALAAVLVPLLAGCAAADAAGSDLPVRAQPVGLAPAAPDQREVGRLRYLAGFRLKAADQRFGGFSALWIQPDGSRMIALSDGGTLWQAPLEHGPGGELAGFGAFTVIAPALAPGDPRHPKDQNIEAAASDEAGGLVLAFEGTHRLRRLPLDRLDAVPGLLPTPKELQGHGNRGLEALVDLPGGGLLALSEGERAADRVPGWLIGADTTQLLAYRPEPGFAPTGADRLGASIYVLERRFSWLGGFQSRVVVLPAADAAPGAVLEGEELAILRPPLRTENFEALAVRPAPDGRTLLYLMSDDNFNLLQSTLLLQFELLP